MFSLDKGQREGGGGAGWGKYKKKSKSKPLNGTETRFRRALISNNSVSLALKKELWAVTRNIGAGRGGWGKGVG